MKFHVLVFLCVDICIPLKFSFGGLTQVASGEGSPSFEEAERRLRFPPRARRNEPAPGEAGEELLPEGPAREAGAQGRREQGGSAQVRAGECSSLLFVHFSLRICMFLSENAVFVLSTVKNLVIALKNEFQCEHQWGTSSQRWRGKRRRL